MAGVSEPIPNSFEDPESVKDKEADIQAVRQVLDEVA